VGASAVAGDFAGPGPAAQAYWRRKKKKKKKMARRVFFRSRGKVRPNYRSPVRSGHVPARPHTAFISRGATEMFSIPARTREKFRRAARGFDRQATARPESRRWVYGQKRRTAISCRPIVAPARDPMALKIEVSGARSPGVTSNGLLACAQEGPSSASAIGSTPGVP